MAEPLNSSSGEEEEEEAASSAGSGSGSEPEPEKPQPSTCKRPAAEADGGDMKRKKTVVAVAAPDADTFGEKKNYNQQQLFQRLWSEENEIELIQGMIDYFKEKGKDPLADVNDFHDFVKRSLHVNVNHRQVLTKARRLKKKFENNAAKVVTKGKVRSFSNPHEKKMYELSKILWGSDSNNVNITPKTKKAKRDGGNGNVVEPKVVQPIRAVSGVDAFGLMGLEVTDEVIMNKGMELLSGVKKDEMEGKWRRLKVEELEHFLKKLEVLKEQAEVVLNAVAKAGGN